jgi:hypothetical protein
VNCLAGKHGVVGLGTGTLAALGHGVWICMYLGRILALLAIFLFVASSMPESRIRRSDATRQLSFCPSNPAS